MGEALDAINKDLERQRATAGGYQGSINCRVDETSAGALELCVTGAKENSDVWKMADPWGFAVWHEIHNRLGGIKLGLRFEMPEPSKRDLLKYEAFKRRLSYLAEVNESCISVVLSKCGEIVILYRIDELANRPDDEVVRNKFDDRSDKDRPGRLEKDFQSYLFGKGLWDFVGNGLRNIVGKRTNERLALFGDDFSRIGELKPRLHVEREFPTGAFKGKISGDTRILPTEYIDLVTINKNKEIAIIELKFDDDPLEVVAQLLNYALFFFSYKEKLTPLIDERLGCSCRDYRIKAYLVSNVFHPRLDDVWRYYCRGGDAHFGMRIVRMGYMEANPS